MRPLCSSAVCKSGFEACHAGTKPKMRHVPSAISIVKPSTLKSKLTCAKRGTPSGTNCNSTFVPNAARVIPATVPNNESNNPSRKNCRTKRARPAPNAARIAISLLRPACWANNKLATLAHAIRSTKATAPSRVYKAGLTSPTTSFMN